MSRLRPVIPYNKDMNKTTRLETSADGIFMHSANPSPLMESVMDSIREDMLREAAQRKAIREGRLPLPRYDHWGVWNISDRD